MMTLMGLWVILSAMIIAIRQLTISNGSGQQVVTVRIHAPVAAEVDYSCTYEIDWPGQPEQSTIFGIDSAQALVLALTCIGSSLYGSTFHTNGQLNWNDQASGYGFPVVSNLRELLVGDDKNDLTQSHR